MRNPDSCRNRRGDSLLLCAFFTVVVAGCVLGIALTELRPRLSTEQQWEEMTGPSASIQDWLTFEVRYPDNYFLDCSVEADNPLALSVVDASGGTVYTRTGGRFSEQGVRLRLNRGQYAFRLSDYGEGAVHVTCSIG